MSKGDRALANEIINLGDNIGTDVDEDNNTLKDTDTKEDETALTEVIREIDGKLSSDDDDTPDKRNDLEIADTEPPLDEGV